MRLWRRVALTAVVIGVAMIEALPVAASDIPSFREWIADQRVALYVFDEARSHWTVHSEWLPGDGWGGGSPAPSASAGSTSSRRRDRR
jgi:hypothetical protein